MILTGDLPPSALPQKAFDAGQTYERLARDLDQMMEMARNVSLKIGDGMPEEARRQFDGVVNSLTSGRGKTRLDEFQGQLRGVRLDLEDKSRQIYEMYWQVMAALLQMLALLAWVAFLSLFGFGGLGGLSEAIFNRARVAVLASIATLMQRIKVLPGVFEAFEEALLSFAVQLGNKLFGNKLFKRNDLDWGDIGKDALFGFFAGGIGEILGGTFNKGKDLFSKLGKNPKDFGVINKPSNFDRIVKEGYGNANDFVSEGFGESLGAAAMGLFFAGYSFSWATFVSAGSSGVVERNLEGGVEGLARGLRNKFINPPPTPDGVNGDSDTWPNRSTNSDSNPNSTSDSNSNPGSGSSRNNDRNNGTNGRTGPRTVPDLGTSGGTRRPPVTTSTGDPNGTGGGNPTRNGNAGGDRNGSGSGRPPVVATRTQDLPDLSTYQPGGGDTSRSAPSMPVPGDAFRNGAGQDTRTPGSVPGTNPVAGDGAQGAQRPGGPQPVRMPIPASVEPDLVRTLGTDPALGTNPVNPANPSDPATGSGQRSTPQPGTAEPGSATPRMEGSPSRPDSLYTQPDTDSLYTEDGTSSLYTDSDTGFPYAGNDTDPGTGTVHTATPATPDVAGPGTTSTASGTPDQEVPGQRELTMDQQEALIVQGVVPRASGLGEDSLVLALEATAPDLVTGTPAEIRAHLSHSLVAELEADPGTGSRPLWTAVDAQAQAAVANDRTADRLRLGDRLPRSEIYAQELRAVHRTWGDHERRSLAYAMGTYTSASDATDDVLPLVAGQVYGLTVNVVQPNGTTTLVGSPDGRSVTVARLPRPRRARKDGKDRDRWLAAARPEESPQTHRLSDDAFQRHWDQLPTDTVGFVRAADAARSLLAEHGRVAGPFAATPFSDLGADDRAARRLAVILHGDPDLYRDADRHDEALARALHLLDEPVLVRPVTESSEGTATLSDTLVDDQEDRDDVDVDVDDGRLSVRAFQRHWDKINTDTPELARAAATARSLLSEHGRVTDPLTSTPFADLGTDDRAARRLTDILHSDPGLRTDPARRAEARAWAAQLLEDPMFPSSATHPAPARPVMESGELPDDGSDIASVVSSISSVSSVSSDEGWARLPDEDPDSAYAQSDAVDLAESLPLLPRPDLAEPVEPGTQLPPAYQESPPAYEQDTSPPAEPQPELPAYSKGEAVPGYQAERVNPAASPALVSVVSKHLRADRRRTAALLAYDWFDVKAADGLRRELGLRKGSALLDLAETIGRVPDDLPRIAAELGLTPYRLFDIARNLGADPRHIAAVLGPNLRDAGEKAAADLGRSAGWKLGGRDGHPAAGAHPQGKGWLLAVAAHHGVSWEALTEPRQGLARYLSSRTSTAPVLTPPDHLNLVELVEEWNWGLGFGPRGGRARTSAAWESDSKEALRASMAEEQAEAEVKDLLAQTGATVDPHVRDTLVEAAAAHLFLAPADTEGARATIARHLDEAKYDAETAALRTDLPFDPAAFDRLWTSARREASGTSLESALADARGLVGPLRRLPATIDRDTDPYRRLEPEDQVVRRVAHHLYTWPGDTDGARALARRLVADLPPSPPALLAGAKKTKKKAKSAPQQPSHQQAAASSTVRATPAANPPDTRPSRITADEAQRLAVRAVKRWTEEHPPPEPLSAAAVTRRTTSVARTLVAHSATIPPALGIEVADFLMALGNTRGLDGPLPALRELVRHPDVLVAVSNSEQAAAMADAYPGLAARLSTRPRLLAQLTDPDITDHADAVLAAKGAADLLVSTPELLDAMESDDEFREHVLGHVHLVETYPGRIDILRELLAGRRTVARMASLTNPVFAEFLKTQGEGERRAALATLDDNIDLSMAVIDYDHALPDVAAYRRLFGNAGLLSALGRHPRQARTVLAVPG
ncbi:hypothetical protein, partial [Streptomyces sp. NPDC091371]|uniref:hypothetical protein n=1 Tax=Streptomyces sp. NPDC091371 TaxID=3155303 RepID=UPI00342A7B83